MTVQTDPFVGRLIQDTWRVEEFVARGSMGSVYRATNVKIGTPVAVKVLNQEFLHDEEIRARFRREATISSRCDSPHLVKVMDLVVEPDGYVALIMEWLHGESLAALLKRRGSLSVSEVRTLLGQVGEGLAEAHAAGIIHRDLKPGNIFLAESGHGGLVVPKVLDFGISKVLEEGADLTGTATMMGTPHYMPVEQFDSSRDVDSRADIYALGVICYELLAGRRPFAGSSPVQILNKITTQDPPPLPEGVPASVAAVVLKAMARDASHRFSTVEELVDAFGAAADGGEMGAQAGERGAGVGVYEEGDHLERERLPVTPWRRWRLAMVGGALLLTLAGTGLAVGLCGRSTEPLLPGSTIGGVQRSPGRWRLLRTLQPRGSAARALAIDGAGALVAGVSLGGELRLWRLDGARPPEVHGLVARTAALSPDGRLLALGDEQGRLSLRSLAPGGARGAGEVVLAAPRHQAVLALAFSGDGNRLLSGDGTGNARVWDVVSRRMVALLPGSSSVVAVALSGDGALAVVAHRDGSVVCWDVAAARRRVRLTAHVGGVTGLALHQGSALLVTGGADGLVRVWRLPGARPTGELRAAEGPLAAVGLSEDGRRILSAGVDGTVRIWDQRRGKLLAEVVAAAPLTGAALALSGRLLLLAGPRMGVQVWAPPPRSEAQPRESR